ncbi:hydroxyisourate hydrolase [Neokomagataea tanensis]|uniref:5-hydroxyisourate hydrolase n=1 Tax=Neokomagataea tanensis TaxID=661191 RepID=A0A4Y6V5V3_9PROT|nr:MULTISPECIES: hydroxyisourate hydrolase [Neokomagataea]QDH25449.1 hydroxyisourate hydrolase [Neokomagataea tanensis]
MSSISTHVLDTVSGKPAVAVALRLWAGERLVFSGHTNEDGRCPAIRELELSAGKYKIEFDVGEYFLQKHYSVSEPLFLDVIPIAFGLSAEGHVHVPLLVAPHGYSTYRGS